MISFACAFRMRTSVGLHLCLRALFRFCSLVQFRTHFICVFVPVYVVVCVFGFVCAYICVFVVVYVFAHMLAFVQVYIFMCLFVFVRVFVFVHVLVYVCDCVPFPVYVIVCVYVPISSFVCVSVPFPGTCSCSFARSVSFKFSSTRLFSLMCVLSVRSRFHLRRQ